MKSDLDQASTDVSNDEPIVARLHVTDISDRIAVMRIQEETFYTCRDYFLDPLRSNVLEEEGAGDDMMELEGSASAAAAAASSPAASKGPQHQQSKPVDAECRTKMAEWCAQVIDFCKFSRETVGVGISFLDRFMASGVKRAQGAMIDRKEYQLAAMTALYMAIKLNEPLEMETKLLSDLSRGCYNTAEIAKMELDILDALGWRVAGPTPLAFVQHFLAVGLHGTEAAAHPAVEATLLDFSRFQTELSIGIPALLSISPSRIALASILNSMEAIDDVALNPFERISFVRSVEATSGLDAHAKDLPPIRSLLLGSFVRNSGIDFKQVASQLGLGAQRQNAERDCNQTTNSDSSGPEISPVCVSSVNGMKKQRCV